MAVPDDFLFANDESMGNTVDAIGLHVALRGFGIIIDGHAVIHFFTHAFDERRDDRLLLVGNSDDRDIFVFELLSASR
jgi:hypothetical protein